jgi:hypothetical protein
MHRQRSKSSHQSKVALLDEFDGIDTHEKRRLRAEYFNGLLGVICKLKNAMSRVSAFWIVA